MHHEHTTWEEWVSYTTYTPVSHSPYVYHIYTTSIPLYRIKLSYISIESSYIYRIKPLSIEPSYIYTSIVKYILYITYTPDLSLCTESSSRTLHIHKYFIVHIVYHIYTRCIPLYRIKLSYITYIQASWSTYLISHIHQIYLSLQNEILLYMCVK